MEIDLEGFERRLVVLPPEAGNYSGVVAAKGKLRYLRHPRSGSSREVKTDLIWRNAGNRPSCPAPAVSSSLPTARSFW